MVLKVCDRCGCEIKPNDNNPGAIKIGWTGYVDLCDVCMKQLVVFLGCEPKRIGMKDTIDEQEKALIKKEIDETLERIKEIQEKHAK